MRKLIICCFSAFIILSALLLSSCTTECDHKYLTADTVAPTCGEEGYTAEGRSNEGYGGDIVLMVGFKKDKKTVISYKVLQATETPGLGMKLKTPEFADQFAGKDGSSLKVKKDGGEIEAITSATITSRAVCKAIADAQKKLQ